MSGFRPIDEKQIEHWFTYHSPTQDQIPKYIELRQAAKAYAHAINRLCPEGADKAATLRQLRAVNMSANMSIACHQD